MNGAPAHARPHADGQGATGTFLGGAALRDALLAFLSTRPLVLLVGYLAVLTIGLGPRPGFVLSRDPLANLPARFDAGWYGGIALSGYDRDFNFERQRNTAFFPALPLLMRPVGRLFGTHAFDIGRERRMARMLWAGTAVSLAGFLLALWYVASLAADAIGASRARAATLLLAAYPFAVFYGAPYTESLFLLGAVAAFYHFRRGQWWRAAAWGLLVGLTRPNGAVLSLSLGLLALSGLPRSDTQPSRLIMPRAWLRPLLAACAPLAGTLAFTVYLHALGGGWFAWARSHQAWGRGFDPLAPFVQAWTTLRTGSLAEAVTRAPYDAANAAALLFACALLVPVFRRLGVAMGVFVLVNLLLPFASGGVLSMGRTTSTLFPLFLAFAAIIPQAAVAPTAVAFGVLQGLAAALFFTWRPLF